jgi:hypothetical protein
MLKEYLSMKALQLIDLPIGPDLPGADIKHARPSFPARGTTRPRSNLAGNFPGTGT